MSSSCGTSRWVNELGNYAHSTAAPHRSACKWSLSARLIGPSIRLQDAMPKCWFCPVLRTVRSRILAEPLLRAPHLRHSDSAYKLLDHCNIRRTRLSFRIVRFRNDLYCVEWGVKLYSLTHSFRIGMHTFLNNYPHLLYRRVYLPQTELTLDRSIVSLLNRTRHTLRTYNFAEAVQTATVCGRVYTALRSELLVEMHSVASVTMGWDWLTAYACDAGSVCRHNDDHLRTICQQLCGDILSLSYRAHLPGIRTPSRRPRSQPTMGRQR